MADNFLITQGSGTTVRAVEKSSIKTQVVTLDTGGFGSESLMSGFMPVRGFGTSVSNTLTVTNGLYSIADVVGGLITFANAVSANGKHSVINSIKLSGVVAIPYELWFFQSDIATPRADNAVFGLAAADGSIFLGAVPISTIDYNAAQTAFYNATIRGVGLEVQAGGSTTSIYAYLKTTATTSPGTTTLYLIVDFEYLD